MGAMENHRGPDFRVGGATMDYVYVNSRLAVHLSRLVSAAVLADSPRLESIDATRQEGKRARSLDSISSCFRIAGAGGVTILAVRPRREGDDD